MIFKLLNSVMLLLFTLAVVVQYNDPDPVLWMLIYGVAAALCVATMLKWHARPMLFAYMAICAARVVYLSPRFADTSIQAFASAGMSSITEEEVRELWGLVIFLCWSVVLYVHSGDSMSKENAGQDI